MKRSKDYPYSEISSFEDLRMEKERLILKSKLTEIKIKMDILLIRRTFSVPNLVLSVTKESVLPQISDFIKEIFIKRGKI
jgi:hypothetical protein